MNAYEYITPHDIDVFRDFCVHHAKSLARGLPAELWHYTDANGLIGILKSGKVWSTQIACLNDNLEQRYFGDLVHEIVRRRRSENNDGTLEPILRVADLALAERDFAASGLFVACFSEVEDDLGQWRGYGGGECGYAIGFQAQGILDALKANRPNSLLLPANYAASAHDFIAQDVVRMAELWFRERAPHCPDRDKLAHEIVLSFALELSITACVVKYPKFAGEVERRIATFLQTGEHTALEFRQKRTLLARHLPVDLTVLLRGKPQLPITRIYVGPGPAQRVTKITVGDLLLQAGYEDIPVELSKVPYRVP